MATIQDITESYLSQTDKLELSALLGHGPTDDMEEDECEELPSRATLSPAEYVRQRCTLPRDTMVKNGLHPAHVSQVRRSLPVGWAW